MPMLKRDYKRERELQLKRGEDEGHTKRLALRREAVKAGMVKPHDGKDVSHKVALSRGGSNTLKNAKVQTPSANRSFARNPDGSMKSEKSRKERK